MESTLGAFGVEQARKRLGDISSATIYELINSGELKTFTLGRRRLVSAGAIQDLIRRKEAAHQPTNSDAGMGKSVPPAVSDREIVARARDRLERARKEGDIRVGKALTEILLPRDKRK
jgi:hypothetical protein